MPLVKNGSVLEDPYLRLPDGESLPEGVPILVTAERLLADQNTLAVDDGRIGVLWPNNRPVSELAPHLDSVSLVALHFPTFRDGRAYSQARLLREHYGFRGELRATGEVLRDQYLFLRRAGFDAFEVKKPGDAIYFTKAPREFTSFYQPAADRRATAFQRRRKSNKSTDCTPSSAAVGQE